MTEFDFRHYGHVCDTEWVETKIVYSGKPSLDVSDSVRALFETFPNGVCVTTPFSCVLDAKCMSPSDVEDAVAEDPATITALRDTKELFIVLRPWTGEMFDPLGLFRVFVREREIVAVSQLRYSRNQAPTTLSPPTVYAAVYQRYDSEWRHALGYKNCVIDVYFVRLRPSVRSIHFPLVQSTSSAYFDWDADDNRPALTRDGRVPFATVSGTNRLCQEHADVATESNTTKCCSKCCSKCCLVQ